MHNNKETLRKINSEAKMYSLSLLKLMKKRR